MGGRVSDVLGAVESKFEAVEHRLVEVVYFLVQFESWHRGLQTHALSAAFFAWFHRISGALRHSKPPNNKARNLRT